MSDIVGSGNSGLQADHSDVVETMVGGRCSVITYAFPNNSFSSGQTYRFVIPRLDAMSVIDPKTIELEFEFVNANNKSWFLNNLGRLLVKKLEVTVGGTSVYTNNGESLFSIYHD